MAVTLLLEPHGARLDPGIRRGKAIPFVPLQLPCPGPIMAPRPKGVPRAAAQSRQVEPFQPFATAPRVPQAMPPEHLAIGLLGSVTLENAFRRRAARFGHPVHPPVTCPHERYHFLS